MDTSSAVRSDASEEGSALSAHDTFSTRAAVRTIDTCRQTDPGATIASVLRDSDGRTMLRVRASETADDAVRQKLLDCMQGLWPSAGTSLVQNPVDGVVEAEIVVPTQQDEKMHARDRAASHPFSRFAYVCTRLLFVVGILLYANDALGPLPRDDSTSPESRDL